MTYITILSHWMYPWDWRVTKIFLGENMTYITNKEIAEVFINANLEEDYNFLEADLVKIANAFINFAQPRIAKEELDKCVEIVRSMNPLVADKLKEVRERK